jgi:hypothetical protein
MFGRKYVAYKKRNMEGTKGGIYIGPTKGLSVPKNHRKGCLCLDSAKYSKDCCNQFLQNQGIGQTQVPPSPATCKRWIIPTLTTFESSYTVVYIDCNGNEQTITSNWYIPPPPPLPEPQPSGTIIRLVAREIISDGGLGFELYDENNVSCDVYNGFDVLGFGNIKSITYLDCDGNLTTSSASFNINVNAWAVVTSEFQVLVNTNLDT